MTDTSTTVDVPMLVGMMHEKWKEFAGEIASVDEKLNTDGGKAALARAAIENLPEETVNSITNWTTHTVNGLTGPELLAVTALIRKVLRTVEPTVAAYVEANKTEAAQLSDDEATRLRESRKVLVDQANAMRGAAKASDPAWAETGTNLDELFPTYTNLRGGGKRVSAPRFKGSFSWVIDGKYVGDMLPEAAKKLHIQPTEFKLAMQAYYAEKGVELDFANPPDDIEFIYIKGDVNDPDNHAEYRVTATRKETDADDEDAEDDGTFDEDVAVDVEDDASSLFADD